MGVVTQDCRDHPLIEVSLQGFRRGVDPLAEGDPIELVQQRFVEPLANAGAVVNCVEIRVGDVSDA